MRLLPLTLAAIVLIAPGCTKSSIDNKEAVKQGVVDYLAKRKSQTGLDMNLMNVEVTNVTFEKNEAKATVSFKPKGSENAAGGMSMGYTLERQGDKWVVKGRQESGLNPHGGNPGGAMGNPGAMPPAEGGAAMPPNHPPVEGAKPDKK